MSEDAFPTLRVARHPLLAHEVGRLRDARTPRAAFRRAMAAAAGILAAEATRDLSSHQEKRDTPVDRAEVSVVARDAVTLVPILRAGLGMLPAFLDLLPEAAVGLLGLERDEDTREAREYYAKLPDDLGDRVLVIDPTIATGGTAASALDRLREAGAASDRIRLVSIFVAPEGLGRLLERHPDVRVLAAALDDRLDDAGQIVPGLGDAGDRLFGTDRAR